jgi:hypothetical protein
MSVNAPGQLLGYSLQFPRALLRLLEAKEGDSVGIEVCGDITVFFPEGIILSEEDKSSINENPLSDRSSNLWKTFYNWCKSIENGYLKIDKTKFVLYSNCSINTNYLVSKFSYAKTKEEVNIVLAECDKRLSDIAAGYNIYPYVNYVLKENKELFGNIIKNFELETNSKSKDVYCDIKRAIRSKCIEEAYIEYILDELGGWLQKEINKKISNKEQPIIHFEDFYHRFVALFGRVRQRVLIDFAINKIPDASSIILSSNSYPIYVKQLEIIKLDESDIMEAISDYYRAATNRQNWIEKEILDESSIEDFENRLISYHKNQAKTIELTYKERSEEDRGKILLLNCQQRTELIEDMTPPDRTIQGSYHALSDTKQIGWHPRWNTMIKNCTNE